MGMVAAAATRAAAIGTAAAALGVLAFTAIADSQADHHPAPQTRPAAPTHPVTPVPDSTLPGSVESPGAGGGAPQVTAAQRKRWLRALVGMWARDTKNTYFRFHPDGSGEWVAFGQELWTGTVHPRDARTFDLTDPAGHGGSYWQVRLLSRGRMLFAGTRQTFMKTRA